MKSKYIILSFLALPLLAACSKDDSSVGNNPDGTPLDSPTATVVEESITPKTIAFEWTAVKGAIQYGYVLQDMEGKTIDGGVTVETSAIFSDLEPTTEYEFSVWAFAPLNNDSQTNSKICKLKVTTAEATQLDAPVVSASTKKKLMFSWKRVDNATSYVYTLTSDQLSVPIEEKTDEISVSFTDAASGEYTFAIKAVSSDEWYSDSETTIKTATWTVPE